MKISMVGFFVLLMTNVTQAADGNLNLSKSALEQAEIFGMCGTLKQLSQFQQRQKIPGGDDFIKLFLMDESSRFGLSLSQLQMLCRKP